MGWLAVGVVILLLTGLIAIIIQAIQIRAYKKEINKQREIQRNIDRRIDVEHKIDEQLKKEISRQLDRVILQEKVLQNKSKKLDKIK